MANQRVGGIIELQIDGEVQQGKGEFTWNIGRPKREAVISHGSVDYKETTQAAFIEGEITDPGTLDVDALVTAKDVTVTLTLGNGKVISLYDAARQSPRRLGDVRRRTRDTK